MKFLHIADVHLGCTRYQLAESPRDFFDAWMDVLRRYAIGESVEFVIICGDFFHKKSVPPETMNYAVEGLNLLKQHGIPVVMIEGNHDQHYADSNYSWLRSLADWDLIHLLEPAKSEPVFKADGTVEPTKLIYEPWNAELKRGGFIDIGRARIFGSHWYGASGNWAIPMLTEAIGANSREGAFQLLMLHTDVEGHQTHPIPAISVDALKQLKSVTNYVGLGHTHMHYEIENWAFNPGSIEVTNISEFRETRGAFVVTVGDDNSVYAQHVTEYRHRPFQRLPFEVTNHSDPKDITSGVAEMVGSEARVAEPGTPAPIIEVILRGQLGFPNSMLEIQKIREQTQAATNALHVRVKNHSVPIEMGDTEINEDEGRERVERKVVDLIVAKDARFRMNAINISEAIVGAKRMALSDDEPEKIAEFIAQKAV